MLNSISNRCGKVCRNLASIRWLCLCSFPTLGLANTDFDLHCLQTSFTIISGGHFLSAYPYQKALQLNLGKLPLPSMSKTIRDIAILIAFCSAFLLLIFFVRGESTKAATSSNFSMDRLEGDRTLKEKNWEQAIVHFTRLVEKDKYNGLAQMSLSKAAISKLYDEGLAFAKKVKAGKYTDDEEKDIAVKLRDQAVECMEIQNRLIRFERYRPEAYHNLAALHCFIGDDDEAMKALQTYVGSNSYNGGNIRFDQRLSSLWEREDFQKMFGPRSEFSGYNRAHRGGRRPW